MDSILILNFGQPKAKENTVSAEDILAQVNYFSSLFFLLYHPILMIYIFDWWANFDYLLVALSAAQAMQAAFCWVVTDIKYQYWVRQKLWVFYILMAFNGLLYFGMLIGGMYVYFYMKGVIVYYGLSLITYALLGTSPLLICTGTATSFIYMTYAK